MEDEQDKRAGRALVFAGIPPVVAALLLSGWFPVGLPPFFTLLVALMGAPVAGVLVGRDTSDKVFSTLAAMVGGAGVVSATSGYIEIRRHLMTSVELLVPILLGGLPGLGLFLALRALAPKPLPRVVVAFVASALSVALVAAC